MERKEIPPIYPRDYGQLLSNCPYCRECRAPLGPFDNYCPNCGSRILWYYCKGCKAKITYRENFCSNCGTRTEEDKP